MHCIIGSQLRKVKFLNHAGNFQTNLSDYKGRSVAIFRQAKILYDAGLLLCTV